MEGTTATASAPSSAPAGSAPSAPASSPSTTTDTTLAPSFEAAFADNPLPDATDAPVTSDPASATPDLTAQAPIAPADAATTPDPADKQGPIPFKSHKTALDNARTKTKEETLRAVVTEYGEHIKLANALVDRPVEGTLTVLDTLLADPTHGPALKAQLAQRLGMQAPPQKPPSMPEIDVVDANGQPIGYSVEATKQLIALAGQQALEALQSKMAPVLGDYEARQERQRAEQVHAEIRAQARTAASQRLEAIRSLPHFEAALPEVKALLAQAKANGTRLTAELAFAQVLATSIVPKLKATAEADLARSAQSRASAATTSPGTARPAHAHRPKTFEDAFRQNPVRSTA